MRYPQRNLLYWNDESAYVQAGRESGLALEIARVSRGTAFGDYDNDGDVDILVVNLNNAITLMRNDGGNRNGWIGLRLAGSGGNGEAFGAHVRLSAAGSHQAREVRRSYGYQSSQDVRLLFGLGAATAVDSIEVRWPSGRRSVHLEPELRRYHLLREPGTAAGS